MELGEASGNGDALLSGYDCLAMKLLAQGDVQNAMAAMEKADKATGNPTVRATGKMRHAADRVLFSLRMDDLESANEWGTQLSQYTSVVAFPARHVPPRLLIAQGQKEAAGGQLRTLYEDAVRASADGFVIMIRVYQALAARTQSEALTFLAEALEVGQRLGYVRTFVDEGRLLTPLLRQALAQGIAPEYTTKLLSVIEGEALRLRADQPNRKMIPSSFEFLSERELEALRLVAEGLSNQQIAEKLVIGLTTAKTHVYHAFAKLNVKDRLHAVARAKELKLI